MKKLSFIFNLLLCLVFRHTQAQSNQLAENRLVLVTEDASGKTFRLQTQTCFMVLTLSSGDFTLTADMAKLLSGIADLDSAIAATGEQLLLFKGNINQNLLQFNQRQNDEKEYDMPGVLSINDLNIPCTAKYDPINLADKSEVKNYRMDFMLSVDPAKIKIKGLEGKLNRQLVIEVMGGKLNIQN